MIQHENNYNKDIFLKHISKYQNDFKTIIEVGSRDGLDTIFLNKFFDCKVHSFEPNPDSFKDCLNNLSHYENSNMIKMNNLAVWNENTVIKFFPVTNGNHGAKLAYRCSFLHPTEKYEQIEIEVESITLKKYCESEKIEKIDLLVMDAQGAEYNCLLGLEDKINDVSFIITEALFKPLYNDAPLNDLVKEFLEKNNFSLLETWDNHYNGDWWGDQIYINNKLL